MAMMGARRLDWPQDGPGVTKVEQIIHLCKKLKAIHEATDQIRYDEELFGEVPEVVKALTAAKDAVIAELKAL
jgi:uncharacterized protein with WD repeat